MSHEPLEDLTVGQNLILKGKVGMSISLWQSTQGLRQSIYSAIGAQTTQSETADTSKHTTSYKVQTL